MAIFELTLTGFQFPKELPNNRANFRFVVDLRFINDKDRFTTEHAVMPSLDTFWECDTEKKDAPNYVRKHDVDQKALPRFDFEGDENKIDPWDRLILMLKGKSLHSIQFKVFDVDRKDAWDKVKNFLGGMVEAFFGRIKGIIPGNLPLSLSESMGGAADDVQSFLLKKLAGGDKVLFRGSRKFTDKDLKDLIADGDPKKFKIRGHGTGKKTKGDYKIGFSLSRRLSE